MPHYVEVSMVDGEVVVESYEHAAGAMERIARAEGDESSTCEQPFPYTIVPASQLPRD